MYITKLNSFSRTLTRKMDYKKTPKGSSGTYFSIKFKNRNVLKYKIFKIHTNLVVILPFYEDVICFFSSYT